MSGTGDMHGDAMHVDGTQGADRVPQLLVERLAAGELTAEEATRIRARLAEEAGGMDRLAAIAHDDEQTLARWPVADMAEAIHRRAQDQDRIDAASSAWQRPAGWRRVGAWGLPALAAAALLLMLRPDPPVDPTAPPRPQVDVTRAKGDPLRLVVHRRTNHGSEPLSRGDAAAEGDLLQVGYRVEAAGHGVILSIDGRGQVTVHLPADDEPDAPALQSGTIVGLPHSYQLDDAPNFERFFFVYQRAPFATSVVISAAERLAEQVDRRQRDPLDLDTEQQQVSFWLRKVPR